MASTDRRTTQPGARAHHTSHCALVMLSRTPPAPPASPIVAARMARVPRRDTAPELAIRRRLHAMGLRYYVDRPPLPGLRRRADLVFPRLHVAVFIDGCFWHGCPAHGNRPLHNGEWWRDKLARNQRRDRDTDRRLVEVGWTVFRAWEHDEPSEVAERISQRVEEARSRCSSAASIRSGQAVEAGCRSLR